MIQYLSRVAQFFFHKKKLTVWFFILTVIFFWKPASVLGQETVVTPTITVTERYESNPRFIEGGDDDWEAATIVSPEVTFTRNYAKSDLRGTLGSDLEYYPNDTDLNNERYRASLDLERKYSLKTTFIISERFSFAEDSRADPDSAIDTGV